MDENRIKNVKKNLNNQAKKYNTPGYNQMLRRKIIAAGQKVTVEQGVSTLQRG